MQNIHKTYVQELYDSEGVLSDFSLTYPDRFNFGYDVVDRIADTEPDRLAMIWVNPEGEEHKFTFADIKIWSNKTANYLASLGIGKGDPVMVIARRHYQFWFIAVALHKLGAVMIPATFMLKEHDLEYRLNASSTKAIICTAAGDIAQTVDNVVEKCPSLEDRILLNGGGAGLVLDDQSDLSGPDNICILDAPKRAGWLDFNKGVREADENFTRIPTSVHDPFLMYFSSGTTGNPKMVLHDGAYALAHLMTAKHWHNVVSDDGVHFTIADTGWGKAVWGKLYGQWLMEACVFTYDFDRFNAEDILSLMEKYGITTLCCPPTMYRLMAAAGIENYDLSKMVYSTTAGEALNPDLFEMWEEATGLKMFEGFGQTETVVSIFNPVGSNPRPGSMGKPSPHLAIDLHTEDGRPCNRGQTGEIVIDVRAGKPEGIMTCYYREPERTEKAIRDGFYHTGDLAWVDEDGYYWYVGRNDDVIKSSGYRIGPFEVESVLLEHDAIKECAVTGIPDPVRGFAVKATVVLNDGFDPSEELTKELQTHVKKTTAPYKYPRVIDYIDELPKTVNGKIRRSAIREADEQKAKDAQAASGLV
ncbi:MAG: AMP-binding protein [Coriobacteriia bacterium]|nr:AMP-binding protein [Coriobacteriia bacterium]